jgi:hypothetical protein
MSNDWIKMRTNLADDPAVIGIAALLKLERPSVVGRLHALWGWADQHSEDGFLEYVTPEIVDEKAGKRGFAEAMASVHWIEIEHGGVRFPHFDRHNGASAKKRALATERQRDNRSREPETNGHAFEAEVSRTPRDKSVTRERVRLDKKRGGGVTPPPPEPPPPRDKIVDRSDFEELARLFPFVDIEAEHEKALVYVRLQRGPKAELELRFFAEEWLPKAPTKTKVESADPQVDGPKDWQAWMDANFPDWVYATGRDPGPRKWSEHTVLTQKFVQDTMKKGGAL